MNENLKKALEIAKQGGLAMRGYNGLIAITIGSLDSSIQLELREFLQYFSHLDSYREEEGPTCMHLHAEVDGINIVALEPYKDHYKKKETANEPEAI